MLRGVDPADESHVSILPKASWRASLDLSGRGLSGRQWISRIIWTCRSATIFRIYSASEIKKMGGDQGKSDVEAVLPDDYEVRGIFDVGLL